MLQAHESNSCLVTELEEVKKRQQQKISELEENNLQLEHEKRIFIQVNVLFLFRL